MVHACWKSWVFSRRLKVLSDSSGAHCEGGRLFQVAGPNTAKLRWPVEVRTLGKRRVPVVAERNWRLPSTNSHCVTYNLRISSTARRSSVKWRLVFHALGMKLAHSRSLMFPWIVFANLTQKLVFCLYFPSCDTLKMHCRCTRSAIPPHVPHSTINRSLFCSRKWRHMRNHQGHALCCCLQNHRLGFWSTREL